MKKMEPRSVSVRLVVSDLGKFLADSSYLHNYHVLMCACTLGIIERCYGVHMRM